MNAFVKRIIYGKEGPEITPETPEKRPFFKFWEILWNKRFKLIGINLIYFVCNLLSTAFAAASYVLAVSFYFTLSKGISVWDAVAASENPSASWEMFFLGLVFVTIIYNVVPVYSAGPFRAGLTYITKSFVKREPVFLWSDYIDKTRSNLKLGILAMVINGVLGFWSMILIAFYMACTSSGSNMEGLMPLWLLIIAAAVSMFFVVLLFGMSLYIYPLIVTFRLTLKQLYKDAFLLALIKWLPNLGILLLTGVLTALPLLLISGDFAIAISILLYLFFGLAYSSFLHTFCVYPVLKKYMIDNEKADKSGENTAAGDNKENDMDGDGEMKSDECDNRTDDYEEYLAFLEAQDRGEAYDNGYRPEDAPQDDTDEGPEFISFDEKTEPGTKE